MIILKAMQKDPNCRYQNATEMLDDLRRALKNPDDDFVVINKHLSDSPTQRIPSIYDMDLEKNADRKGRRTAQNEDEEEDGFFKKHKAVKIFLIILICIGLFFGAMFISLSIFSRPSQIDMPNLVKDESGNPMTEEQAKALLDSLGLTYTVEHKNSDTVEKGYVISQKPEYQPNFEINLTEEFVLTVSDGSLDAALAEKLKTTKVKLPKKMVGKKKDDLIEELESLTKGLNDDDLVVKYEIAEEFNEEVEAGVVTAVDHEGGEEITLDTTLQITVSKGSQYKDVTVPSVVNKSEADARNQLTGLGLNVEVTYEENTNKSDGVVISQDISATKIVKEGTTINLSVNKLPTKSTVTVSVNLKSLMKYTEPEPVTTTVPVDTTDSTNTENAIETPQTTTVTTTPEIKSAKVVIKVGEDTIYSDMQKLNTTNITASYQATGVKDVKVYVDDVVKFNRSVDFAVGDQTIVVE